MRKSTAQTKKDNATVREMRSARPPKSKANPEPTIPLSENGRKTYDAICEFLAEFGALYEIDSHVIASAAHWHDIYCRAIEQCNENGIVQTTGTGYTAVTGYWTAMEKASNQFNSYIKHLGLSPQSRESLKTFLAKKTTSKKDPFEDI